MRRLYCARATCCRQGVKLYKMRAAVAIEHWTGTGLFGVASQIAGGGGIHAEIPFCPRHASRVSRWGFGLWQMRERVGTP